MPVLVEEWTKGVEKAKSKGKKSNALSRSVVSKSSITLVPSQASSELAFKLAKDDYMVSSPECPKFCEF